MRRQVYADLVAHPEAVPREILTMAIAADAIPGAYLAAHSKHVAESAEHARDSPRHHAAQRYGQLPVPTLFAWGDSDAYGPLSSGQSLARQMPNARLEIIAGAGHMPQLDQPSPWPPPLRGI
jgi:pimeloyl-ACP methyl ester carboxylesterase